MEKGDYYHRNSRAGEGVLIIIIKSWLSSIDVALPVAFDDVIILTAHGDVL